MIAWLQARQDSQALAAVWTKFVAEEEGLLWRQPRDTSPAVVESLLRFQVAALRKIDRGSEAAQGVDKLIKLRDGNPVDLGQLLSWLIEQKDWPAMRRVENRCQAMIADSADLLYLVAEAQVGRGDAAASEQSAIRALKLNPENDESSLGMHYRAGVLLEQRGRLEWATKEWEHVIHNAPPRSAVAIFTARSLAELYHDQEEDAKAAETLRRVMQAASKRTSQWPLMNQDGEEPVTLGTLRPPRLFRRLSLEGRG